MRDILEQLPFWAFIVWPVLWIAFGVLAANVTHSYFRNSDNSELASQETAIVITILGPFGFLPVGLVWIANATDKVFDELGALILLPSRTINRRKMLRDDGTD